MKKSELKSGMRITLRNGKQSIVLLNTSNGDIYSSIGEVEANSTWGAISNYNKDLKSKLSESYDIVKVDDASCNMDFLHRYDTVWERSEPLPYNAWYKHNDGAVVYFTDRNLGWGLSRDGKWCPSKNWTSLDKSYWTPLTYAEVEQLLLPYFEEKYPIGVIVSYDKYQGEVSVKPYFARGSMCMAVRTRNTTRGNEYLPLFDTATGELSAIIEAKEVTMAEVEEKFGCRIKIKK